MLLTIEQLKMSMPYSSAQDRVKHLASLTESMDEAGINTPMRMAIFIAQVCHESGSLRYTKEIASGKAYEGRKDLGNVTPGDGMRYKGRGLIQLTGRSNYLQFSKAADMDFISRPELLESPPWAAYAASWFWHVKNLNATVDRLKEPEDILLATTRVINGGKKGLADRRLNFYRAMSVFGAE